MKYPCKGINTVQLVCASGYLEICISGCVCACACVWKSHTLFT